MIDEWGDELEGIQDEGVFSDSALGGFPNTMTAQFPYAGQVSNKIKQVADNKYAVYDDEDGTPVQSAFPGQGMGGMGAQVRQATAGMGDDFSWDTSWVSENVRQSATPTQQTGGTNWQEIMGGIGAGLSSIGDAVATGFEIARAEETHDLRMQAAQQQLDQQMQLFQAQLARESDPELQRLLAQARAASGSGNLEQMMAVLAQMQRAQRSWVPWVVGGVAVVAVGGLVYWLVTKDDKE